MRNYTSLILVFILFVFGCKKEIDFTSDSLPAIEEQNGKVTSIQNVTTVDGNITQSTCFTETLNSGEIYQICKPANWNGELILYAHGYVNEFQPLALPDEASTYVPLFISQGYAFATTSYSENGLAIQSGINNILALRERFIKDFGKPSHIYLTGGSEGAVVTTLAIERYPDLFSGGLPLCGPCGSFQKQINYYGDFRVLFDYFFPGVLPGDILNIPDQLITNWETVYVPAILQAISKNPTNTLKLLRTANAAYDPNDNSSIGNTVIGVLRYNVFATRDAIRKLGGQPFDNSAKIYFGSGSILEDIILNKKVKRYRADKIALENIQKFYETSGKIKIPVVSGHTTRDPIIPFWHLPIYQVKTIVQGSSLLFTGIPVERYGHCIFTEAEIAGGFGLLVQKVKGQTPVVTQKLVALSSNTKGKIVQTVQIKGR
jgi:hypothetical protein